MNMVRIFLSVNDFIRFPTGSLIDFLLSVQTKNSITQKKIEISRLLKICPILLIVSKSGRVCVSLSAALNFVYNSFIHDNILWILSYVSPFRVGIMNVFHGFSVVLFLKIKDFSNQIISF